MCVRISVVKFDGVKCEFLLSMYIQWFRRSNVCVMAALHVEMSQQAIVEWLLCSTIIFF